MDGSRYAKTKIVAPAVEPALKMADAVFRQKALVRINEATEWATSCDAVYQRVVEAIADVTECDNVVLFLLAVDGDVFVRRATSETQGACSIAEVFELRELPMGVGRVRRIMEGRTPVIMDYEHPHSDDWIPREVVDSGAKLTINVPVAAGDEVMGLCSVTYHRPLAWSDELTDFVMDVGRIVGVFVRRVKTTKNAVSLQLLDERKRLSAEIHDTTAQVAGALSLAAASARVCCDEGKFGALRSEILKVECLARDLVGMLRDEMTSLCAPLEQTEGLVEGVRRSLDSFERNWGISTDLRTRVESGHFVVSMEVSLQAMRILNECLSNVLRHSGAHGVCVELAMTRKGFSLIVEDDGGGFDPDAVAEDRFGIRIMRERAALAGGSLSIISGPEGTSVCLDVMRR